MWLNLWLDTERPWRLIQTFKDFLNAILQPTIQRSAVQPVGALSSICMTWLSVLNSAWYRMLYSCTHTTTVGVKVSTYWLTSEWDRVEQCWWSGTSTSLESLDLPSKFSGLPSSVSRSTSVLPYELTTWSVKRRREGGVPAAAASLSSSAIVSVSFKTVSLPPSTSQHHRQQNAQQACQIFQ